MLRKKAKSSTVREWGHCECTTWAWGARGPVCTSGAGLPRHHRGRAAALPHTVPFDITGRGEAPLRKAHLGSLARRPSLGLHPPSSQAGPQQNCPRWADSPGWRVFPVRGLGLGVARTILSLLAFAVLSRSEIWHDLKANVCVGRQAKQQTNKHPMYQSSLKALPI